MVRSKDLGKDILQAEDLVIRRVAIKSQDKIVRHLVAPVAANDLGRQRDTRLCDVTLDGADEVCCVTTAAGQSRYRCSLGVPDQGVFCFPNGFQGRRWCGSGDWSGGLVEVSCNNTIFGVTASSDVRGEVEVESIDDLVLGHGLQLLYCNRAGLGLVYGGGWGRGFRGGFSSNPSI